MIGLWTESLARDLGPAPLAEQLQQLLLLGLAVQLAAPRRCVLSLMD